MTDSKEKDSTGDNPEQAAKPDTTKQVSEPESAATDDKPKPEPEATQEEKAKPDVSEISIDEIFDRDDVKRTLQSGIDRAVAKEQRKATEDSRQRERAAYEKAERDEIKKLREEEDFDQIGRRAADKADVEERTMESLRQAGNIISQVTTEQYERELGEETVARIRSDVDIRGGSIVDFGYALAEEKTKRERDSAVKETSSKLREEFKEDMEALRTELGVKTRSKAAAEGETPVESVSGGTSGSQTSEEETWESMTDKYNAGEITGEEYAPFRAAHEKERRQ